MGTVTRPNAIAPFQIERGIAAFDYPAAAGSPPRVTGV